MDSQSRFIQSDQGTRRRIWKPGLRAVTGWIGGRNELVITVWAALVFSAWGVLTYSIWLASDWTGRIVVSAIPATLLVLFLYISIKRTGKNAPADQAGSSGSH